MGYDFLKGLHNLGIAQPLHGCGSNATRVHLRLAGGSGNLFNLSRSAIIIRRLCWSIARRKVSIRRATPLQDKLRTISASVRDVTATDGW